MRKITYTSLLRFIILTICILMMGGLLFFLPIEKQRTHTIRFFVMLLGMGLSVIVVSVKSSITQGEYSFAKKYVFIMIPIILFFVLYTCVLYDYSIITSAIIASNYFYIFYSWPIIYILVHEKREYLWNAIIIIVLFFTLVRSVGWYLYTYYNLDILHNFVFEYSDWVRGGIQRLTGGSLFGLAFLLLLYKANYNENAKNKMKMYSIYTLIIALILYTWFVTQSRYNTVVMVLVVASSIFITRKKQISKMAIFIMLAISVMAFIISGIMSSFVSTFSANGLYGSSTLARLDGLSHFGNLFVGKGHYIGLGFLANGYGTESLFVRTATVSYYLEDLGAFEVALRFGVFSIIIYGFLFVSAIKTCKDCLKVKSSEIALIFPVTAYMILTGILSNIFMAQNAFIVPFYIAIISYVDGHNKSLERETEK